MSFTSLPTLSAPERALLASLVGHFLDAPEGQHASRGLWLTAYHLKHDLERGAPLASPAALSFAANLTSAVPDPATLPDDLAAVAAEARALHDRLNGHLTPEANWALLAATRAHAELN